MSDEKPAVGRPFTKGVSGNPGGRTKAHREIARYIRTATNDGRQIADTHLAISRGQPMLRLKFSDGSLGVQWGGRPPDGSEVVATVWPDLDDIQHSASWCADRGIGKTVQPLELRDAEEVAPEREIDWDAVPLEKRKALLAAMDEIETLARKPDDGGSDSDT